MSGRWVWAFCSEEEQIKKKRERKKSEKKKKVTGGMWLAFGAHNLLLFTNMPLKIRFWVMRIGFTCFHFPWPWSGFLSDWIMKTMTGNSSKQLLLRGTHTIWMMKTENWLILLKTHPIQTTSNWSKMTQDFWAISFWNENHQGLIQIWRNKFSWEGG